MKKTLSATTVATTSSPAAKRVNVVSSASRISVAAPSSTLTSKRAQDLELEYQRNLAEMTEQTMELKVQVDQVEKERDFYFDKLREIEVFVQEHLDGGGLGSDASATDVLDHIQAILYKTEDGFEIPDAVA
ncbi:hypothetical protein HK100_005338, partial [Physocladia obscura]